MGQAMIGEPTAVRVKKIMTLPQGGKEIDERRYFLITCAFEATYPGIERLGPLDRKSVVRAEGWKHPKARCGSSDRLMMGQIFTGIVAGANGADVKVPQDSLGREIVILKTPVGTIPDGLRGVFIEKIADAEIAI